MADILQFRPRMVVVQPVETPEAKALRLSTEAMMAATMHLVREGLLPADSEDPMWAKIIAPVRDLICGAVEYKLGIDTPLSRAITMIAGAAPKEPT